MLLIIKTLLNNLGRIKSNFWFIAFGGFLSKTTYPNNCTTDIMPCKNEVNILSRIVVIDKLLRECKIGRH